MFANVSWASISSQSRQLYILAGVASILFILGSTTLFLRSDDPARTLVTWPTITSTKSESRPVIEVEGINLGRPFTAPVSASSVTDPLAWLFDTVQSRFAKTMQDAGRPKPEYPMCSLNPSRYEHTALHPVTESHRWQRPGRSSVISIAINLKDSEGVIPAQSLALLEAIAYLLTFNKVYISIYENGSMDQTHALLSDFGAALQALKVDGIFIHSSRMISDFGFNDRIVMLSEIRNLALTPLMPYAETGTLIFINDVMMCASDVLELVHQQRLQKADMVFGMDWGTVHRKIRPGEVGYKPPSDPEDDDTYVYTNVTRVYDMWVGRGIDGDLVYPFKTPGGYTPMSANESWVSDAYLTQTRAVHQRWLDGLPIPMYSGWGGMSAFDASLFTVDHLRFRSSVTSGWTGGHSGGALGTWGQLMSAPGYLEQDCPGASECKYVGRDIWNIRNGKARIVMATQVRTTYSIEDWHIMIESADPAPTTLRTDYDQKEIELIDWSEVEAPEGVVCIPSRDKSGGYLDVWAEYNHRYRVNPMYKTPAELQETEAARAAKSLQGSGIVTIATASA
nr:hypothetical protein B0A51_10134 [Rachicladosporium sp. CCFEE 5018]